MAPRQITPRNASCALRQSCGVRCRNPAAGVTRPLADRAAVVELITATTAKTGFKVEYALDTKTYEKGIKVSDTEMETLNVIGDSSFHPKWNYTIRPRRPGIS